MIYLNPNRRAIRLTMARPPVTGNSKSDVEGIQNGVLKLGLLARLFIGV